MQHQPEKGVHHPPHQMRRSKSSELSSTMVAVNVRSVVMTTPFMLFSVLAIQQLPYHTER
jgi:hypothetical protein